MQKSISEQKAKNTRYLYTQSFHIFKILYQIDLWKSNSIFKGIVIDLSSEAKVGNRKSSGMKGRGLEFSVRAGFFCARLLPVSLPCTLRSTQHR